MWAIEATKTQRRAFACRNKREEMNKNKKMSFSLLPSKLTIALNSSTTLEISLNSIGMKFFLIGYQKSLSLNQKASLSPDFSLIYVHYLQRVY